MTTDRMAAALSAITLIENPRLAVMAPQTFEEASMTLSAAVWCGVALTGQLAKVLEVPETEITTALRESVTEAFTEAGAPE